jgi:SAM-dependent methyltransferase
MRPVPPTGHWHEDYERGRPGWPAEALDVAELGPQATVLELGAGTGKLTRLLVARFGRATAVEPDPDMRRVLCAVCPAAEIHAGRAEAIPLAGASVDAVFVAEAFQWFDVERALAEIARVLRPQGALVLMWNVPGGPTQPSIDAAERLLLEHAPPRDQLGYDPVDLNSARFSSGTWQTPFPASPFDELREVRLVHVQTLDRGGLLAFYESMSWVGELPEGERQALLDRVGSLLGADEYRRPWETRLFWTRLGGTR